MLEAECGRSNRRSKVLVGPWRFQIDQDDRGEQGLWFAPSNDTSEWGTAQVPGPWNLLDHALWGYEGVGWYATEIDGDDVVAEGWQQLIFGRVNMHAKVWLNGHFLGEHIGGHLPFLFAATQYLHDDGLNRLVIRVSNVPRVEWLPGSDAIEWVLYGGILQPVVLLTTDRTYISDLRIVTEPGRGHAEVTCHVEVTNRADANFGGRIKIGIPARDGTVTCEALAECSAQGSSVTTVGLEIPDAVLWSPQNPHLYSTEVSLRSNGTLVDQVDDRFGVRTVQVRGSEILLNGQPVFLKGVNRYDEYAGYGPTVPADVVRDDLLAIKRTGANMVRVHYPQDPVTLRLMDEIGLLLMEETGVCWWKPDALTDEQNSSIIELAQTDLTTMIRRDKNHPCIIAWSMLNESGTDTEIGIAAMRQLLQRAHALDSTRMATFVSAGMAEGHDAFEDADFVAINAYHGLFQGDLAYNIAQLDELVRVPTENHLRTQRAVYPAKPYVLTEFGTQGVLGIRGEVRFAEDYQAAYIAAVGTAVSAVDGMRGLVLWCWADYFHRRNFIGTDGKMIQSVYGPYGVVTIDRKPKQSLKSLEKVFDIVD